MMDSERSALLEDAWGYSASVGYRDQSLHRNDSAMGFSHCESQRGNRVSSTSSEHTAQRMQFRPSGDPFPLSPSSALPSATCCTASASPTGLVTSAEQSVTEGSCTPGKDAVAVDDNQKLFQLSSGSLFWSDGDSALKCRLEGSNRDVFGEDVTPAEPGRKSRLCFKLDHPQAYGENGSAERKVRSHSYVTRRQSGQTAATCWWLSLAFLAVASLASTALCLFLLGTVLDLQAAVYEQGRMLNTLQNDFRVLRAELEGNGFQTRAPTAQSVTDRSLATMDKALAQSRRESLVPATASGNFLIPADRSNGLIDRERSSDESGVSAGHTGILTSTDPFRAEVNIPEDPEGQERGKDLQEESRVPMSQFWENWKGLPELRPVAGPSLSRRRRSGDWHAFDAYFDSRISSFLNALPRVHLTGLAEGESTHTVGDSGTGRQYFLWQTDRDNFHYRGVTLQHHGTHVKAIVINEPGVYFVYSQVVLNGTNQHHNAIGCTHETVEILYSDTDSDNDARVLMSSFRTQDQEGRAYSMTNSRRSSSAMPRDTVLQVGLFRLYRQSQIRVRIPPTGSCRHIDFATDARFSSFGLFKLAGFHER